MKRLSTLLLLIAFVYARIASAQGVSHSWVNLLPIFNAKDYGAVCNGSTDDTTAFSRTLTAITSSSVGGILFVPGGDCVLSAGLAGTVGPFQRLIIRSDGMHGARLHWSNSSSAGFSITLTTSVPGQWISDGPSFSEENITNVSTWSTTTAQQAISVTATGGNNVTTFQRPSVPSVFVKNVNTISSTNSGGFLNLLSLTNIATVKIEDLSMWASPGDTTAGAVVLASTSAVYTGLRFDGIRQQGGGTALTVTDAPGGAGGFQGIYVTDMQTVGTQHSISWTNPNGYTSADNLQVDHSQLNSHVSEIVTSGVAHVQVSQDYFLGCGGWIGVSATGGSGHTISNSIFECPTGDATSIGILFTGVTLSAIANNIFYGLTGTTSSAAPILLTGAGNTTSVNGNVSHETAVAFDNNSGSTTDRFTNNVGAVGGVNVFVNTVGAAGTSVTNFIASGNDSNIQTVFRAKGLPNLDFNFQDGNGHTLLTINDSQSSTANAINMSVGGSGVSPTVAPQNATNILFGASGSPLATNITSGLPQIPYMAGKPTGVPVTTGGASMVFDTTDNELCIYNPTGTPAWKCSAPFPN